MKKSLVVLLFGILGMTSLSALAITQDEAIQRETQMQILSGYHADTPVVTPHSQTSAMNMSAVSSVVASLKSTLSANQDQAIQREAQMETLSGYNPAASIVSVGTPVASMGTFVGDQWRQWPVAQDVAIQREAQMQALSGYNEG